MIYRGVNLVIFLAVYLPTPCFSAAVADEEGPTDEAEVLQEVEFQLRTEIIPPLRYYPNNYEELRQRAEKGDVYASWYLGSQLSYCRENRKSNRTLENRREQASDVPIDPRLIALRKAQSEFCDLLSDAQIDESEDWKKRAATSDDSTNVIIHYAFTLEDIAQRRYWLNRAWRLGDPSALLHLSRVAKNSYRQSGGAADLTDWFAMRVAYKLIQDELSRQHGEAKNPVLPTIDRRKLAAEIALLRPDIRDQIHIRAVELFSNSSACCVRSHDGQLGL